MTIPAWTLNASAWILCSLTLLAQAPAAPKPSFEVASVKPNTSGSTSSSVNIDQGGRLTGKNQTVRNLVRNAWNLQPYQMVGGPDWISTDHFDLLAKIADADMGPDWRPRSEDIMLRVQSLLEDRFKLVTHRETRELPAYALVILRPDGKLGDKLKSHTGECGSPDRAPANGRNCGTNMNTTPQIAGVTGTGISMETFARNLAGVAGRFVVDRTGLTGLFDLDFEFTPDQSADTPGASLFTALQEQLGLKLDAQRAPVEVLVIDSVAQPTPD
jgi:uncharacterized protein (TIGR03435 family)